MCIFHATSLTHSFKDFIAKNPDFPVYQNHDRGDEMSSADETSRHEDYGFSCDISERKWADVEGQITDMISFLEVYTPHLQLLQQEYGITSWRFDLPYECELTETHFMQVNFLPPKLLALAGKLNIGIELSLYWPSADEESPS